MDQLFIAPTFMAAATMAAAIDSGLYDDTEQRVLLVINNAKIPEIGRSLGEQQGFESLARRFDRVVYLNELIFPYHPRVWNPPTSKIASWRDSILEAVGIEGEFGITLQSLPVRPSTTLTRLFKDAPIDVVSDGLMSYGPTRKEIRPSVAENLRRLLYLDLAGGLRPVLLSEHGIENVVVPAESFRAVVQEYGKVAFENATVAAMADKPVEAIMLGQYLAALGLLTEDEEEDLHHEFLRTAVALGYTSIAFKPHPSAPPTFTHSLVDLGRSLGVELVVLDEPVPVEILYDRLRPVAAIGCFSTGLSTAVETYGMTGYTVGVDKVLERLPRFQDSNRIPLAITDVRLNRVEWDEVNALALREPPQVDVQLLVEEVARAMQPDRFEGGAAGSRREQLLAQAPWAAKYFVEPEAETAGETALVVTPPPAVSYRARVERKARRVAARMIRKNRRLRKLAAVGKAIRFQPH
ncbi:polysialyltransferase family glycosyltransferase [Promicromonospora sukumoe]|uniref:polysialyltransferase family glycosyltransferase n=1 Tax=Promicromonospora sukumoe TaxID=88382 RepID=UPI00365ED1E7